MSRRAPGDSEDTTAPDGQPLAEGVAGVEPTRRSDPLVGQMLGQYRVEERLGHGGMGFLYRGVQPVIGKPVAIKVVLQEIANDRSIVQRMLEEARAASAVRHPNIVDVFAFGELPDGRPYIVMELLDGQPLAELLKEKGRLSVGETLNVLNHTLAALEAAHAAGVVHRDLKPDNMFVTRGSDGGWRVKLIDFGLAKRQGTDMRLTKPGTVMGTPAFMAPEQVRGGHVTGKADVYSVGVVAWTLLMGREPFMAGSVVEVMHQHLSAPVPALGPQAGELPHGLEALVRRMMEKDPAQRPDAREAREEFAGIERAPRRSARAVTRPALLGLAAVGVVLAGLLVWTGLSTDEPPPAPVVQQPPPRPAPRPVEAPEPTLPPVAPPAPAPPRPAPALSPSNGWPAEHTWSCKKIVDVTPVMIEASRHTRFFSVYFDYGPPLLVFITNNTQADADAIQVQRDIFIASRGTEAIVNATHVMKQHSGYRTSEFKHYGGDVVYWQNVWLTNRDAGQ